MKVKVVCGDITKEKTDAIVNSTNSSLDLNSGKIPLPQFQLSNQPNIPDIIASYRSSAEDYTHVLSHSAGVSGAILKAAGQTVVDECKALGMSLDVH